MMRSRTSSVNKSLRYLMVSLFDDLPNGQIHAFMCLDIDKRSRTAAQDTLVSKLQ